MPDAPMSPDVAAIRERLDAVPAHVFDGVAIDLGTRLVSVLIGEDLGDIAATREADAVVELLTDLHATFDVLFAEITRLREHATTRTDQVVYWRHMARDRADERDQARAERDQAAREVRAYLRDVLAQWNLQATETGEDAHRVAAESHRIALSAVEAILASWGGEKPAADEPAGAASDGGAL